MSLHAVPKGTPPQPLLPGEDGGAVPDFPPEHEQALLLQAWRMMNAGDKPQLLRTHKGKMIVVQQVVHCADDYRTDKAA